MSFRHLIFPLSDQLLVPFPRGPNSARYETKIEFLPHRSTANRGSAFSRLVFVRELFSKISFYDSFTTPGVPSNSSMRGRNDRIEKKSANLVSSAVRGACFSLTPPHWGDGDLVASNGSFHGRSVPPGGGFGRARGVMAGKTVPGI